MRTGLGCMVATAGKNTSFLGGDAAKPAFTEELRKWSFRSQKEKQEVKKEKDIWRKAGARN